MTTQEIPEALSALFDAILAYQNTQEGLANLKAMAENIFGDSWREELPTVLQDFPEEYQANAQANIDRALTYDRAILTWGEVSQMLDPRRPVDVQQVSAQIPSIKEALAIFGKAGQDLVAKLEVKLKSTQVAPASGASSLAETYGLTVEQLWSFEHFVRLKTYYDLTISRTSARCVHLGGLELTQYPYYGYILDLLDEILTFGMEIITPPYAKIVRDRFKGGLPALKKVMIEFKADFENNAPPEMLSDDESLDEIKERLGSLADNVHEEEDIGPAPDGFEAPEEEVLQVLPQRGMVKAPRKVPMKVPVRKEVPMKRPVPAGA